MKVVNKVKHSDQCIGSMTLGKWANYIVPGPGPGWYDTDMILDLDLGDLILDQLCNTVNTEWLLLLSTHCFRVFSISPMW